eukprot:1156166-Pelagomonas_calceolata.AAC.5
MASEVIDAGRFDMTTTMDERKATLEAMLQASRTGALAMQPSRGCVESAPALAPAVCAARLVRMRAG